MKLDQLISVSPVRPLAMTLALLMAECTCFAQQSMTITTADQVLGTWETSKVNSEGKLVTHNLQLKPGAEEDTYEHVWEVLDENKAVTSRWEAKFIIEPAGKRMVALNYTENRRVLPEDKTHDWRPFGFSFIAQRAGNQLYASIGLDQEMWIWRKVDGESAVVDASKLDVLKPLLETYSGEHDHLGSEAYGASKAKQQIKTSGTLSPTGTVLTHQWTSLPIDANPEDAFEARGVFSYSVKHKTIIKQYHTSTGVMMTGVLVNVEGKKMLWERTGEGPAGSIHEFCQFDFSEPGVFIHKIISRSLNGVPTKEAGQTIVLQKQD